MDHGVDPVTREIVKNALAAAADEMAIALYRTAYSTIVRDCLDYSTSLCDGDRRDDRAGGDHPPAPGLGAVRDGDAVRQVRRRVWSRRRHLHPQRPLRGRDAHPGHLHRQAHLLGGSERIAFSVSTAHHLDLGGRLPGSSACDNTEIFQDGLRIPWLKMYRRGEPDEALLAMIRVNVRVPEMTLGDLRAQVAACHTGERAVHELVRRYGPDTFRACTADLIDYTERLVRAEIARWPDGTHTFTDYMDSDGVGGPPVKLHVALTVSMATA